MCILEQLNSSTVTIDAFNKHMAKKNVILDTPPRHLRMRRFEELSHYEYDKCLEYNLGDMGKMRYLMRSLQYPWRIVEDDEIHLLQDIHNPIKSSTIVKPDNSWVVTAHDRESGERFVGWGLLTPRYTDITPLSTSQNNDLVTCCLNGEAQIYVRKAYRKQGYGREIWQCLEYLNILYYGEKPHCTPWNAASERFFASQEVDSYLWK